MKDIRDQSYYELLEIEPSASQEEILKAYNRARATYGHNSPALYSLFNKEEAQELLRLIDEAYSVLSNQFKRKQYDNKGLESASANANPITQPASLQATPESDLAIPSAAQMTQFYEPAADQPDMAMHGTFDGVRDNNSPGAVKPTPVKLTVAKPAALAPVAPTPLPAKTQSANSPGTTPFGTYKIDSAFEEEIRQIETFSGEIIQRIRLYKNVTLDQISEVTKVSRPYLVALEGNNYSSLPAQVFVRGFLLQIAKALSLDGAKVANSYLKVMKEGPKK